MSYRMVAQKLVDRLFHTIDNKEYYNVILYGLEIAISTLVNMILVITLALVFKIPMETLTFCLFFMPLRLFAGGAHAKSHSACIGLFLLCELGSIYISKQVSSGIIQYILISIMGVISFCLCIAYAAKSKKANPEVKRKHRRISLVIITVDLILITLGTLLDNKFIQYSLIAGQAVFCQSIALLPIWDRLNTLPDHE